jgi:type IX secretion system PorP/SprF family membrane protein
MKFKYLILPVVICVWGTVKSQSDFDLSQRWFNESVYNPGATGNSFSTGVFFHSRAQWAGLDGAPITNALTIDTYAEPVHSAFGLSVYTDKIGYINSWAAKFSYAYYIFITNNTSIAFGLSGALRNMSNRILPNMLDQTSDPSINYSKESEYSPDFDIGMELKGPLKVGIAVRHLLKYEPVRSFFPAQKLNAWAYISSRFNILTGVSLEPAASLMYRDNIHRIEGGAIIYFLKSASNFTYSDRFWIGGMYRLNKQFAVLVGANLTKQLRLGYSFDYGTSDLSTISKLGTHELFLSWHFNKIFYKEPDCFMYRKQTPYRK